MSEPHFAAERPIYTITEITGEVRRVLGEAFDDVWVRGEISGFRRYQPSGHLYFQLKDEGAVLACAMWKTRAHGLRFEPADGMEVEARGRLDLYPRTGRFQLLVSEMLPAGRGALLLALEELRRKLAAEGLFAPERKRPLPPFPGRIGLVTSPSGAAVRDFLRGLGRRWPLAEVVLAPVAVQGPGAAEEIAHAIRRLDRWGWPDLLLVGRGGGSLEDLWAFNEEPVVRAIADCRIPVVSAVGHEVDHTLADGAADQRASTPSAAAEIATPDRLAVLRAVRDLEGRATTAASHRVQGLADRLARAGRSYGLRRPLDEIGARAQDVDECTRRLARAAREEIRSRGERLRALRDAYGLRRPGDLLVRLAERVAERRRRLAGYLPPRLREGRARSDRATEGLAGEILAVLRDCRGRLAAAGGRLGALSPRGVLGRGYALARLADGRIVRSYRDVAPGARIDLEFAAGGARSIVESVTPPEEEAMPGQTKEGTDAR